MYWENIEEQVWNNAGFVNSKEIQEIRSKQFKNPVIYVDMDGTLFQWNRLKSKEYPDGVTLEMVYSPGYFRNLKPNLGILELVNALHDKGYDIKIASKSSYTAIKEKFDSLMEYLPFLNKNDIYFIPLNANKSDFLPNIKSNDILIDDYNPNLDEFKGSVIKCVTDINTINPKYPWIENNAPVYKNIDKITWTLIREWKFSQNSENPLNFTDLKYIFDKSVMSFEDFYNICNDFNINLDEFAFLKTENEKDEEEIEI